MRQSLRFLLLSGLAVPAFALAAEEIAGTWQGDGEATWAEMLKEPFVAAMPKDLQDPFHDRTVEMISEMRCVFGKGKALIGTTLAESSSQAALVASGDAAIESVDGGQSGSVTLAAKASSASRPRQWTSIDVDVADLEAVGRDGLVRAYHIERVNSDFLRITITKSGDKTKVIVFRPVANAAPAK